MNNGYRTQYTADCSRKTRQAFIAKAQNGEFIGSQAPYGYKKSKADKHVLEIDEVTAPTVIWMFEMAAYHGYGYNKISRVLTERKVITPAVYQAQCAGRPYSKDPYEWNIGTVYKIFRNEAYLGHLISGKRRKASYKSNRIVNQKQEDWIIIQNNHPALISEPLWNDAHNRLATRKYTSTSGFENIFAGLIKCDKCGYALGIANVSYRTNYYLCNTYKKKGPTYCSSYYILYDELYDYVLDDIRQLTQILKTDKKTFTEALYAKINDSDTSETAQIAQEIQTLEDRIKELETRFDRLYDDRLDGLITDKKFKELSSKCEADQEAAEARISELKKQIDSQQDVREGIDRFIKTAEQYEDVVELDKEILNRLIESIVVGDRIKTDNGREQTITINYRFIGKIE